LFHIFHIIPQFSSVFFKSFHYSTYFCSIFVISFPYFRLYFPNLFTIFFYIFQIL
jgi:hypothetical protein